MADYQSRPTAVVDDGAIIGEDTRVWHFCHISAGSVIGERCSFGQSGFVALEVTIGNDVKVPNNVSLYTGMVIEDDVFLSPSCVLTNVINQRSAVSREHEYKATRIRQGATIGASAFTGAGAVVPQDVPDYALMVGVPARQESWMDQQDNRCEEPPEA